MNTPNFKTLKELRMWHWRQVLHCRQYENAAARKLEQSGLYDNRVRLLDEQRMYYQEANLHLSAVQVLNDALPGTAEQDCAEADNGRV